MPCNCGPDECAQFPGMKTCSLRRNMYGYRSPLQDAVDIEERKARERRVKGQDILDDLRPRLEMITDYSARGFVDDMLLKYASYKDNQRISPAQLSWLHRIADKIDKEIDRTNRLRAQARPQFDDDDIPF